MIIWIFVLFLVCLNKDALCAPIISSSGGISWKVSLSCGNTLRSPGFIPITVEISNHGTPFEGTIEAANNQQYSQPRYTVLRNVSLPRNSNKRYFLLIPRNQYYYGSIPVSLTRRNKLVLREELKANIVSQNDFLIYFLNPDRGGFGHLTNISSPVKLTQFQGAKVSVEYPNPLALPIHWAGYSPANLVVICGAERLGIDHEAASAMLDWVASGGVLLISLDNNLRSLEGTPFQDALPMKPGDTVPFNVWRKSRESSLDNPSPESKRLAEFEDKSIRERSLFDGLANAGKNPLIVAGRTKPGMRRDCRLLVSVPYGCGRVFLFLTSLSAKNLSAEYQEELFRYVLARTWDPLAQSAQQYRSDVFQGIPESRLPSLYLITYLLALYVLLLGPVSYFALKHKGRLLLYPLVVPVVASLFTVAMFCIGYSNKGSRTVVRTVSVAYMRQGQSRAQNESHFAIFTSRKKSYSIRINDPKGLAQDSAYSARESILWTDVENLVSLNMDMWSLKNFDGRTVNRFPGAVTAKIIETSDSFTGTIVNETGLVFDDCIFISKGRISRKFRIGKGTDNVRIPVFRALSTGPNLSDEIIRHLGLDKSPGTGSINVVRSKLLQEVGSPVYDRSFRGPIIMGWNAVNLFPISLENASADYYCHSLFVVYQDSGK